MGFISKATKNTMFDEQLPGSHIAQCESMRPCLFCGSVHVATQISNSQGLTVAGEDTQLSFSIHHDEAGPKLSTSLDLSTLESYLWEAANILRGPEDAADFKTYIFPLLFFKRISDVYDEETRQALDESGGDEAYASFPELHRFQIPGDCHSRDVRARTSNVGQALQNALRGIEKDNPQTLYGIFGDAPWTNKERLSDELLCDLGEPHPSGGLPLIDMLHRLMHLWAAGNLDALDTYAAEKGLRQNELFWEVAQAVLEMAPAKSRERTLLEALVAWGRGKEAPTARQDRLL